jgi:hypothetical protein
MRHSRRTSASFTRTHASVLGAILSVALLSGCESVSEPVAPPVSATPTPPAPPPAPYTRDTIGAIAGFVIDEDNACIIGARVEVIDGPSAGTAYEQTECGFWDYGDVGFVFYMHVGVPTTIRATAEGYQSAEARATSRMPFSYTTMIVLKKEE